MTDASGVEHFGVGNGQADAEGFERQDRVVRAVKAWKGELVDLGGWNTLLYYKDLKQGTLDLGPDSGAKPAGVDQVLSSRTVRLSDLFDAERIDQAARRARTIRAKAEENREERGIATLFLAWGMATWQNQRGTATPAAPVLLCETTLSPRGGLAEDFDLALTGEWEVNPTLLHLLSTDFQLTVAAEDLLGLLDYSGDPPDPSALFERLAKTCASVPQFEIRRRVVVGNFSYAKLPMVLDLETAPDTLFTSEIVCAIAGDAASRDAIRARHPVLTESQPDRTPPKDEYLVLDADASQSYVINAALAGADLVIDGPPGTGKSQTIANLIAALSARGKRILFVAEKRAAIDAVLDRLTEVGLRELVLDLHEGVESKRKLAADLAATLSGLSTRPKPRLDEVHDGLELSRGALVERAAALHANREPWGLSIYELMSRLLAIPLELSSPIRLRGDELTRLGMVSFRQVRRDLERFVTLGGMALIANGGPWASAFLAGSVSTPEEAERVLSTASRLAGHTLQQTSDKLVGALSACGLDRPDTPGETGSALDLCRRAAAVLATFDEAIFGEDLPALAAALERGSHVALLAGLTNGRYRHARKVARSLWRADGKPGGRELHSAVADARDLLAAWRLRSTGDMPPRVPADLDSLAAAHEQLMAEIEVLGSHLGGAELTTRSTTELRQLLDALVSDAETLYKLPELSGLRAVLDAAIGAVLIDFAARNLAVEDCLLCLDYVWLSSILEAISLQDRRIGAFDGDAQRRTVRAFQQLDRQHIRSTPARVLRAVAERATAARDEYPRENDVIQHQARLKRGHLPVRQLFQVAPHVLGALKPCWTMSPLVVSQLLPAERCFDVVIFDEASQIPPADAVGALMRADQAIVAGDPHQLPPTAFFATSGGGEDDEEAEADALAAAGTKNMESVLDAMSAVLPPPKGTRTLSWHYRSRDERLIAFSNAQPSLYNFSLTTFPGVTGEECLSHVAVPFVEGRVGEEQSVTNEVRRVVDLVAEHARTRPDETLGVIAMGIKHANRIEEAIRRARGEDEDLDRFVDRSGRDLAKAEPFFVKNLERVQGDERDAIVLTIGYGKTADGRMLYRFGPINNEGGERRLNVAVTRARSRMTVVSSFSADDMDPDRLRAEGAQMLRRYLRYAESRGSDLGSVVKEKPDLNPFERDVEAKLRSAGIPLVAQYGCSGYWIDFAAKHPTRPGQMVLAIECDGASYHSSATARDRDRLRQMHLERLGWVFHRIWSQEWFYHREAEVDRAVSAYHEAVQAADSKAAPMPRPTASGAAAASEPPRPKAQRVGRSPVVPHLGIDQYSLDELVALVRWIESDTLLRTEEELLAASMKELGFQRRGSRIISRLTMAIRLARDPDYY